MQFGEKYVDFSDPDEEGESGDFESKEFNSYPLPLTFRFGLAMYIIGKDNFKILTSLDAYKPNDNRQHVNGGVELSFLNMLLVRGGYKFGYDQDRYSFGVGFILNAFDAFQARVDYSFADMGILDVVHRGTFGVSF